MPKVLPAPTGTVPLNGDELSTVEVIIPRAEPTNIVLALEQSRGEAGPPGPPGPTGQPGSRWFTGVGPPPIPLPGANPGDYYLDHASGNYYVLTG